MKHTVYLLLLITTLFLVGCGSQATPANNSTPTNEPDAAEQTDDNDGEDTDNAEGTDIDNDLPGAEIFSQFYADAGFACVTCHYPNSNNRLLGPGLLSIEDRYATYDTDVETIEDYIRQSILEPRAFIVPDESPYPENIMPINYGEILSEDDIEALIEYILSF